jgi:hypothetical protein
MPGMTFRLASSNALNERPAVTSSNPETTWGTMGSGGVSSILMQKDLTILLLLLFPYFL